MFGDEAFAQIAAELTLPLLSMMVGRSLDEVKAQPWYAHLRVPVDADEAGRLFMTVNHDMVLEDDHINRFSVTALLGMYIAQIAKQLGTQEVSKYCFSAPIANASVYQNLLQACVIGGLPAEQVAFVDPAVALVAAYGRKITGLGGPEAANVLDKHVLLLDVGHCQTAAVLLTYTAEGVKVLQQSTCDTFGAFYYDLQLFNHFQAFIESKYQTKVIAGTKKGLRLLLACERLRRLLSQLPDATVTVENVCENTDITLRMGRDEFAKVCASCNDRLAAMLSAVRQGADGEALAVHAAEACGGGCRMPHIQAMLSAQLASPVVLGAKLDDTSSAMGAVLAVKAGQATEAMETATGAFDVSELAEMIVTEKILQEHEGKLDAIGGKYNALEALLLEMRNLHSSRAPEAMEIDKAALSSALNSYETVLYEVMDGAPYALQHADASLAAARCGDRLDIKLANLADLLTDVQTHMATLCQSYYAKQQAKRMAVEAELEQAAGEEDEDYDKDNDNTVNRKLKKSDRIRLIHKNKEEGNELFKDKNYRMAVIRYQKAIGHVNQLLDGSCAVSAEEKTEMEAMKLTLYNNISLSYTKMENWELVLVHVNNALAIDKTNKKALYRRGVYYETHKKDMEKAYADYKACADTITATAEEMGNEDKLILKAVERMKKDQEKVKDKEKKMWGKAFA